MVCDRLAQFKYHVKHKKCEVFSEKVEFLGHTVLALLELVLFRTRLMLLSNGLQPICIKDIQAFLGLANYYQWFVKGFT